ncbi:MAG: DNA adenine methylase [Oscillibacter sp.]|nr:DNA adenine methylase [Oscillibacter sp.]
MPNPVRPVLKWVGGKRQLLPALSPLLPAGITAYYEPFLGGGAMLFHLQPQTAYANDINADLMRVYAVIRDDVDALIEALQSYRNDADFFYAVREWDRDKRSYARMSDVQKAARVLYLNKTCYNGLYRVNNAGEFNAPFGNYKRPNIVNASGLRAVSAYFRRADTRFSAVDYAEALADAGPGAFVYLDPPYDPVSDTSNFTGYARGGFSRAEQIRLRECCDDLTRRGVRFMLSNSATAFIREQYRAYHITTVRARRAVNSVASRRGDVEEVVVRNYE